MGASMGQAIGGAFGNFAVACFTAGTPLVVDLEGNSRPIDEIEVGDFVLARSEFDPDGPLELKRVEEKFVRTAVVMELVVHGQSIKTTAEHPFFVPVQGKFVAAGELQVGEQLVGHDGKLVQIESIGSKGEVTTVYNLRVADFHTYFVGGGLWGWDVWVHNARYSKASQNYQPELAFRSLNQADIESLQAGRGIARTGRGKLRGQIDTIAINAQDTRFIPVTESLNEVWDRSNYVAFKTAETNYLSMNSLLSTPAFVAGIGEKLRWVKQQKHGLVVGEIPRNSITKIVIDGQDYPIG